MYSRCIRRKRIALSLTFVLRGCHGCEVCDCHFLNLSIWGLLCKCKFCQCLSSRNRRGKKNIYDFSLSGLSSTLGSLPNFSTLYIPYFEIATNACKISWNYVVKYSQNYLNIKLTVWCNVNCWYPTVRLRLEWNWYLLQYDINSISRYWAQIMMTSLLSATSYLWKGFKLTVSKLIHVNRSIMDQFSQFSLLWAIYSTM